MMFDIGVPCFSVKDWLAELYKSLASFICSGVIFGGGVVRCGVLFKVLVTSAKTFLDDGVDDGFDPAFLLR